MQDWKKIFEIPELKDKLIGKQFLTFNQCQESRNEVLDIVAQEVLSKMHHHNHHGKKQDEEGNKDGNMKDEIDGSESDSTVNEFYYKNKEDKTYRVFNPIDKTWTSQKAKPTLE